MASKIKQKKHSAQSSYVPPVVAVLGHVDHGKTSLLDAIRKTNIVSGEHGGITQKIGASSVEILHEGIKRNITFIDTPGHQAFSKMRSRGTQAADIGLLVVSSVDGVMPQTKESIQVLKEAKIPFIVVLTKSDVPDKNSQKVKQQLLKEKVMLEGLGGDIPLIEVSAKTGSNIKELLELILLVEEMHASLLEQKTVSSVFRGIIIDSKLDQKAGPKATIVIKSGSFSLKDELLCDTISCRVRTIINDKGEHLQMATVGSAVEVLGFGDVPPVGGMIMKKQETMHKAEDQSIQPESLAYEPHLSKHTLSIVLSTDTQGSLEAILQSFPKEVGVVSQKTGEISEADVLLAKSIGAIIVGFNIKIRSEVLNFARTEKVLLKNYTVIYELLDEIKDVLAGKELALQEQIYGRAKVLAKFPFEKTFVLGIKVLEGRVAKGDKVRVMREDIKVGESFLTSLRQGKNSISKVEQGNEAGLILSPFLDFELGDMLICHG